MKANDIGKITIRPDVLKQHNDKVQKHLKGTVFNSGGCRATTWTRTAVTLPPGPGRWLS